MARSFALRRLLPLLVCVAAVLLAAYLVAPHIRATISRNAVLTTWLYVARTPIDGTVQPGILRPGTVASGGAPAARIENERLDVRSMAEVSQRIQRIQAEIAVKEKAVQDLSALVSQHRALAGQYSDSLASDLERRRHTEEAELAGLRAQIDDKQREVKRLRTLNRSGNVAISILQRAEAELASMLAVARGKQELIDRLRSRHDAARGGVLLDQDMADTPWSLRHADEMQVEMLKYDADIAEQRATLEYLAKVLQDETDFATRQRQADIAVPEGCSSGTTSFPPAASRGPETRSSPISTAARSWSMSRSTMRSCRCSGSATALESMSSASRA